MADAALICTPDGLHRPAWRRWKKGYHVLLEKPMSNSEAECRAIAAAAERASRVLCGVPCAALYPVYATLKRLVDEGAVGEVAALAQIRERGDWHHAHSFVRGNWRRMGRSRP